MKNVTAYKSPAYMFDSFMNFIVQFERLALFAARDFHLLAVRRLPSPTRRFDPFCYALRLNNTAHIGRVCVPAQRNRYRYMISQETLNSNPAAVRASRVRSANSAKRTHVPHVRSLCVCVCHPCMSVSLCILYGGRLYCAQARHTTGISSNKVQQCTISMYTQSPYTHTRGQNTWRKKCAACLRFSAAHTLARKKHMFECVVVGGGGSPKCVNYWGECVCVLCSVQFSSCWHGYSHDMVSE